MKKRLLSAFLMICMLLTMTPTIAFAADDGQNTQDMTDAAAQVDTEAVQSQETEKISEPVISRSAPSRDVYTISPDMTQIEVDEAVASATGEIVVAPGDYGIEGEENHIKITLANGNQTVRLQSGEYHRLMLVVLSEGNTLIADDAKIYGDVSTVYNQSPAIYIPYGSLTLEGSLTLDDHDYGAILGYTNATANDKAELRLAENAQCNILNCKTAANGSYDNGIVCNGKDYFSYVDSQGDGTRGSAITTKGKGGNTCVVTVSEGASLKAEDCYGAGVFSVNVANFTLDIRPGANVDFSNNGQGICMNTDYSGSVDVIVDAAALTINNNRSNGITGQSKPYILDIKNGSTVTVDNNGAIGINNFFVKVADSKLSVSGNGSHGATNIALDASNAEIACSDNAYIGLNITKYNAGATATHIADSTLQANGNGGPGVRFSIENGNTEITRSKIVTNDNGEGDSIYGYNVNPGDSGYWAGIVGKGTVTLTDSVAISDSAGGYSLYDTSSAPAALYISGTDVVALDGKDSLSDTDVFDDWNSAQKHTGRTYVTGGSLQADAQQMTKGFQQAMNQTIPGPDQGLDKTESQYSAPVNANGTALTRFDLHQAKNTVIDGDGQQSFQVWDPHGATYEYVFRYNKAEEDLNGIGGNAYVWTPVTVMHYDATEGMIDIAGSTAVAGDVELTSTRGDGSAIRNVPVEATDSYIDATDYTICGNSIALSEGVLPTATRADYLFAGWYYAVGEENIVKAAEYAKDKKYDELYQLLKKNGKKLTADTLTSDDGYDVEHLTAYALWEEGTITITPADITIYTGGASYGSVTDADGNVINESENGLPAPGYFLDLPDSVETWLASNGVDMTEAADLAGHLSFYYYDEAGNPIRQWDLENQGVYSRNAQGGIAQYVYSLSNNKIQGENYDSPVRLEFTDPGTGNSIVSSDDITMAENFVYDQYDMTIYAGGLQQHQVVAVFTAGSETLSCKVNVGTGKLTVKSVVDKEENPTNAIVNTENAVTKDEITAVADNTVTYYVNESEVEVPADRVQLLVDEISISDEFNTTIGNDAVDKVQKTTSMYNLAYDTVYMDLVDIGNGNTVVTMGKDDKLAIYWPAPSDAASDSEYRIVHYEEMDRGNNDVVTDADLETTKTSILEGERVTIDGKDYIKFEVSSFSPFVLVYEKRTDNPGGNTSGGSTPKPDDLNTEDHFAYIIGYPKDYQTGEPTDDESRWPIEPQGDITRAEVATIFFRMLTDEARSTNWSQTNDFTDVAATDWYNNAISTLANMGILSGDPDGSFRPNDSITRAEFTKIAVSFFDETGNYVDGTYADVPANAWYADFIDAAVDLGLIEGYPDGTIHPEASITRAEACTIVNRTLGRVPDKDHLLPTSEMRVWPDNADTSAWYYAQMQEATNSHDYEWTGAEDNQVENWTEKLEDRDWAALEKEWSDANSAPGGEVMD